MQRNGRRETVALQQVMDWSLCILETDVGKGSHFRCGCGVVSDVRAGKLHHVLARGLSATREKQGQTV